MNWCLFEALNMTSVSSWQPGQVCPRLVTPSFAGSSQTGHVCNLHPPVPACTCSCNASLPYLCLHCLHWSPKIRMCLQLQLDNLVTDFQKVTEDLKRRFVVNGEPLIEEGMVVGGSPMGSGSFKRMTGFTLPQRPTMASSGEGGYNRLCCTHRYMLHTQMRYKWAGVQEKPCRVHMLQVGAGHHVLSRAMELIYSFAFEMQTKGSGACQHSSRLSLPASHIASSGQHVQQWCWPLEVPPTAVGAWQRVQHVLYS